MRRQSSVGPLNDTSPLTGGIAAGEAAVSTPAHSATLPVSSLSTNPSSYYTNASPSPPAPAPVHVSCDDILAPSAAQSVGRTSRSAPHSAVNLHQTGRPTALAFTSERVQNAMQVIIKIIMFEKLSVIPLKLFVFVTGCAISPVSKRRCNRYGCNSCNNFDQIGRT